MKLGWKLILAPIAAAVVGLGSGQLGNVVALRALEAADARHAADQDVRKTLDATRLQFSELHAGVYRTVALIGSMDDTAIARSRESLKQQLDGLKRVLGSVAEDHGGDGALRAAVETTSGHVDAYLSVTDNAIESPSGSTAPTLIVVVCPD